MWNGSIAGQVSGVPAARQGVPHRGCGSVFEGASLPPDGQPQVLVIQGDRRRSPFLPQIASEQA
eukprot:770828-Prymnesium_polylepis.1